MSVKSVFLELQENVFYYLSHDGQKLNYKSNLLRKHSTKLAKDGDLSFPDHIATEEQVQSLLDASKQWPLSIKTITLYESRYRIFLDRLTITETMIPNCLGGKLIMQNSSKIPIKLVFQCENRHSVTEFRQKMLFSIVHNLIEVSSCYKIQEAESNATKLLISSLKTEPESHGLIHIMCGPVLDTDTNKKLDWMTDSQYINMRTSDMMNWAKYKYGEHLEVDENFKIDFNKLGWAVVVLELMKVKHSSSVKLRTSRAIDGDGTKCDSFILYNSARVETLLMQFQEMVSNQKYPPLPPLEEINLRLLAEEEEWQLIFNFVLYKDTVIERALDEILQGRVGVHLICQFLLQLSIVFSAYYKRVKILTAATNSKLLCVMQARIYLLQCVQRVFRECLNILGIDPIAKM